MDIETIVIDEDLSQKSNSSDNNNIIDLESGLHKYNSIPALNNLKDVDYLFKKYIIKCLDLENSDGMMRIINRSLIKVYEESDETYRKSAAYNRVLLKGLERLETDPSHKFSHINAMVQTLKFHKKKKRVELITLGSNCAGDRLSNHDRNNGPPTKRRKLSANITIDLDEEIPVINLDDEQSDVIVLEDEKENLNSDNDERKNDEFLEPQIEVAWDPNDQNTSTSSQEEKSETTINMERVTQLEKSIEHCKNMIKLYEEAEVDDDSANSPYVMCEKYKTQIVSSYKELCSLIGHQPKKRKIRLQVLEGHPEGPVRRLESFINENVQEDGVLPFPDFCDVVKCVMVANVEDNLGFSKQQVMNEASALFTQCGRALQKQRQRREYRDLLAKVKEEPEYDPADEDPLLQARLEENKRLAAKKENDILERYTMLQYLPPQKPKPLELPNNHQIESKQQTEQNEPQSSTEEQDSDNSNHQTGHDPQKSPLEDDDSENSNYEFPEITMSSQNESDEQKETNDAEKSEISKVKIKSEPIDIVKMLDDLGDDYEMSIIGIEDPFLVIEISSDSSDDEG